MLKKMLLFLVCINLFNISSVYTCTCYSSYNELSTTEKVAIGGTIITGGVLAAPYVLPASALAAIAAAAAAAKAAAVAGATKVAGYVASTSTVSKVGWGLTAVQYTRPLIVHTTEEKVKALLKEKERKQYAPREEFITCLKQNKFGSARNAAGRPSVCEDLAFSYALVAGNANLNRRTEAFNQGKCFCS